MNLNYVTIDKLTEIDKLRFIKFVYDNTDSFILNTFGHTWSSRDWWEKYPIEVCTDENGKVLGLHAYTVNTKAKDTLKTYYIVVSKKSRGMGIAKLLIKNAINKHKDNIKLYYVNTDVRSDGLFFFKKWLGNNFIIKDNDFKSQDMIFTEPIYNIIDE
jgi:predicted GNAT family acetyltransferase|tara:strand:+ start:222 stop:695 length:474 start_codon:yes stop_codon:yes gene_type:complete